MKQIEKQQTKMSTPLPARERLGGGSWMLFDIDSFHELLQTLLRNKTRSFLTGFGVFWGVFMLIGLIGGGDGMK